MKPSTSSSRAVRSATRGEGVVAIVLGGRRMNSSITRFVIAGERSASPAATTWIAEGQLLGRRVLEHEAARAGPQRLVDVLVEVEVVSMSTRSAVPVVSRMRRVASSPSRFGIRMSIRTTSGAKLTHGLDRLQAVLGLADDLDVRLRLEDHLEPRPDQRLIVDDQDANAHAPGRLSLALQARPRTTVL